MFKNCYQILGVPSTANEATIKSAYRRLALKWHPDRNIADRSVAVVTANTTAQFQAISEAYEILSDQISKAKHDYELSLEEQAQYQRSNSISRLRTTCRPDLSYAEATRRFDSLMNRAAPPTPSRKRKTTETTTSTTTTTTSKKRKASLPQFQVVQQFIALSLEEIHTGMTKRFKVAAHSKNETVVEVAFPKGVVEGFRLSHTCGNVVFEFVARQLPHARFEREGDNLVRHVTMTLAETFVGAEMSVTCLDGTVETFNSLAPGIIHSGYRLCLPGKGLPLASDPSARGDMFVEFTIEYPVSSVWTLTDAQKEKIKEAHECLGFAVKTYNL